MSAKKRRLPEEPTVALLAVEELKYYDAFVESVPITEAWAYAYTSDELQLAHLNRVIQGDDESERSGNSYLVTSLEIQGHVKLLPLKDKVEFSDFGDPAEDVGSYGSHCRLVLIQNNMTNNTVITPSDVFEQLDSIGSAALPFMNQFPKMENAPRFKILMDKRFALNPTQWGTVEYDIPFVGDLYAHMSPGKVVLWKHKVVFDEPVLVHCTSTDGIITDILDVSWSLLAVGNDTACTVGWISRIRFLDR